MFVYMYKVLIFAQILSSPKKTSLEKKKMKN